MSDSDDRYIPLTEDDQGEGIKDFHGPEETTMEIFKKQFDQMREKPKPFKPFPPEYQEFGERINRIETDIRSIKQAIGDHVLIKGQWVDVTEDKLTKPGK